MQVTFKLLNRTTFTEELPEDAMVVDVKTIINKKEEMQVLGSGDRKLIYRGEIMDDEKTLKDYKVNEEYFIVVMSTSKGTTKESSSTVVKETDTSKGTPGSSKAAVSQANECSKTVESAKTPTTEVVQPVSDVLPPIADRTNVGESALVTGTDYERAIQELTNMGFEKSLVVRAMRASYNNPDRAVEYLLSGNIPTVEISEPPPVSHGNVDSIPPEDPGDDLSATESTNSDDIFNQLIRLPQLMQMRALIQADPSLLPQLIHQMREQNPELLRAIRDNEERFLAFLNAPLSPEASLEGEPGDDAAPGAGVRDVTVNVTDDERNAIDRLKDLGFPEALVIQVYFACNKDENAAANILLNERRDD